MSSLSRVKGHKEDTILKWLREAARQAGEAEEALIKDFQVKGGQLDALWLYVGNMGKHILQPCQTSQEPAPASQECSRTQMDVTHTGHGCSSYRSCLDC